MAKPAIRDLGAEFGWGSRVDGVTWDNIHDEKLRADLRRLLKDRGFLVFENMEPSGEMQVTLSRIFGPLRDVPTAVAPRLHETLAPGVIDLHSPGLQDPDSNEGLIEIDGLKLAAHSPRHFDHTHNDTLNYAGVLRAIVSPPRHGRTGFLDGIQLYQDFDPELRRRIEGLSILYTIDVRLTRMRFGRNFKALGDTPIRVRYGEEARTRRRAMHPAVWTRQGGEKVMHLCGWMAVGIEGHEDAEGEALLEAACQEVNSKAHAYWHAWRPTDMLIWDNWRMLHAVEGCEPQHERRMHRTTIEGDYGLGRFEGEKRPGVIYG